MAGSDRLGRQELAWSALLPATLAVALNAKLLPAVLAGGLVNPDSYMRLVRLRETVQAGHPIDIVANDSSGGGTLLHWSHLLDSVLCLLAVPFRLFLAPDAALHAAALLFGPLCMAALGVAVAWAAAPFSSPRYRWLGATLAALSPAVGCYAVMGVVHHHAPAVLVTVMAAGWAARLIARHANPQDGLALGAWAGLGIWLTPESAPLTLLSFGALWLVWVSDRRRGDLAAAIRCTGVGFLFTVAAAFVVDPPYGGYAVVVVDRVSIIFVALAVALAVVAFGTILVDRLDQLLRLSLPGRIATAAASGSLCLAVWIAAFPMILHGSAALLSPADWHAMFDSIVEMKPISSLGDAVRYLLTGTLAALLLAGLALRHRSLPLAYAALCAVGLLLLARSHIRFAAYPAATAAVLLPVAIDTLERLIPSAQESGRALTRVAGILLFLLVPYGVDLFGTAQAADRIHRSCDEQDLPALLAPYAGQVVLSDVNLTPALLYRTPVRTVGSLYHRNVPGFIRLRTAWRSLPSADEPDAVKATGASLILVCPSEARSAIVGDLPRTTLLDRLMRHDVPSWLEPVATNPHAGFVLYRVSRS